MTDFTLKGHHVAIGFVGAFSVIIGVNLFLAFSAVKTFPGLEVKNSYVASQTFDVERAAQEALGWTISAAVVGDVLRLSIEDAVGPVEPASLAVTLGRATHVRDDRELSFKFDGTAHTAAVPDLEAGYWNLRMVSEAADGTIYRQRIQLRVPG
ncbi:MAG: FixH family protein [Silicimonas sp.]|nr:FixH family protein [Silicimonas sp.]